MKKSLSGLVIAVAVASGLAVPTFASAQQHPHHQARVALDDARRTALARVAGQVRHEEMEYERHRWIYSFEIVRGGHPGIEEVNVDADTGAIVEVVHERS